MKRIPIWTPSYVPFMCYVLLESKAQTMAQFNSTLLDLHALLQVFVISLAHLNNVWSPFYLWWSNGRPFWIFFIIDLVIGPFNGLRLGLEGTIGLGGSHQVWAIKLVWIIGSTQPIWVFRPAQPIWVVEPISKFIMNSKHN